MLYLPVLVNDVVSNVVGLLDFVFIGPHRHAHNYFAFEGEGEAWHFGETFKDVKVLLLVVL